MRKRILSQLHNRVHAARDLGEASITCIGLGDGVGSQLHGRLSTLLYARRYGMRYLHTPFENLEHVSHGLDSEREAQEWEHFFNLGEGEILRTPEHGEPCFLKKPHRAWLGKRRFYAVTHCHRLMQWFPRDYEAYAEEFREKYWRTSKPDPPGVEKSKPYLAIHLRRGDVSSSGSEGFRYTSDEVILSSLHKIKDGHPEMAVHVYSQGNPSLFGRFLAEGARLHLDEDARSTFHALVCADILITAKSTFSYTAGMLNQNDVYYEPSWLPPFSTWKQL